MFDARQIANWFIARAKTDRQSTNVMQLLKLAYVAQGWHLETTQVPLFINTVHAWHFGPVVTEIYYALQGNFLDIRTPIANFPEPSQESDIHSFLENIWAAYGKLTTTEFSANVNIAGGAWDIAMKTGTDQPIIPNDLMLLHFRELRRIYLTKQPAIS